jgi:hypothetical protein
LKLKRHGETVFRPAGTEPHETFARLEHGARGQSLQPVKIRQIVGIGFVRPCQPDPLQFVFHCRVGDKARRHDARADGVGDKTIGGIGRIRI